MDLSFRKCGFNRRIASRNVYLRWALSTEATEEAIGTLQCVWNFSLGCNGNGEISSVSLGNKCLPHSVWIFRECCKLWASLSTSSLMLLPCWAPFLCSSILPAASVNSLLSPLVPHGYSCALPPASLPLQLHLFASPADRSTSLAQGQWEEMIPAAKQLLFRENI